MPTPPAHWRQRIEISGLNVLDARDLRRSSCSVGLETSPASMRAGRFCSRCARAMK